MKNTLISFFLFNFFLCYSMDSKKNAFDIPKANPLSNIQQLHSIIHKPVENAPQVLKRLQSDRGILRLLDKNDVSVPGFPCDPIYIMTGWRFNANGNALLMIDARASLDAYNEWKNKTCKKDTSCFTDNKYNYPEIIHITCFKQDQLFTFSKEGMFGQDRSKFLPFIMDQYILASQLTKKQEIDLEIQHGTLHVSTVAIKKEAVGGIHNFAEKHLPVFSALDNVSLQELATIKLLQLEPNYQRTPVMQNILDKMSPHLKQLIPKRNLISMLSNSLPLSWFFKKDTQKEEEKE